MKILFLDQSGQIGGAELFLADVAQPYRDSCLVGLLADGPFRTLLEKHQIPVKVLSQQRVKFNKNSSLSQTWRSLRWILPLTAKVAKIARHYEVIYANTQKAFVIGALASLISQRPLVYHLHDIISTDHFSEGNRRLIVTLANSCASLVIANSKATQEAFMAAGGRSDITRVVYNGFTPETYQIPEAVVQSTRHSLGLNSPFIVGHFSRLSPWKGQHILLEALALCPKEISAILVGDALFGEADYVAYLHQEVARLRLQDRVKFLGFRHHVIPLMKACDLISHTSTAPEPFGRVIVEGMLCRRPVVATAAGGAVELIENGKTGWLVPPNNVPQLAEVIMTCYRQPAQAQVLSQTGQIQALKCFQLNTIQQNIAQLLSTLLKQKWSFLMPVRMSMDKEIGSPFITTK